MSPDPEREFLIRSCGILIHDGQVLAQEGDDGHGGVDYALPGGHLEFGESLALCLSREFYEETGLNVEADKLVYVHENFYKRADIMTHEIGFYFLVDLSSEFPTPDPRGYIPSKEVHIRIRLLPLSELRTYRLLPSFLTDYLPMDARKTFAHPTRHLITKEA